MNWREISMEAKAIATMAGMVGWVCVCVGEDGGAVLVVIAHGGQIKE
jgi:L-alanine-DL-glutamate epimerase-like enolase superfamily enzyme